MTKFNHKEAFALMWYECRRRPDRQVTGKAAELGKQLGVTMIETNLQGCGHRERIWNSRDGVTPFGTPCPSCGGEMFHEYWHLDVLAPDHVLRPGQRFWCNITIEEARRVMERRVELVCATSDVDPPGEKIRKRIVEEIYRDGTAPWLDINPW